MTFLQNNSLGIIICFLIALPAWLLGQHFPVVGGAVDAVKEKAGQAGEAIKNKAEEISKKDLDGDGKIGA